RKPDVFLFDEPLSNLDAELRVSMRIEIARLHRELGNTMVYVTHDQTEAMTLADQIVVLRDGRIEQAGSPRDVYEDPANMFVAGFIGSPRMNFLDAEWQGDGTIRVGETTLEAAIDGGSLKHGERLLLGIRPEHIAVAEPGPERIAAQVEFSEYLGGTRYLYCQLEDGQSLVVEQREGPNWQAGEKLSFAVPDDRRRFFAEDGRRLR
ncbi:ABC transporter ATP-binding protein, partial [Sinorhizobium meliloti]